MRLPAPGPQEEAKKESAQAEEVIRKARERRVTLAENQSSGLGGRTRGASMDFGVLWVYAGVRIVVWVYVGVIPKLL